MTFYSFTTIRPPPTLLFFFFNDTATTEIYTLSLHDALPIYFVFTKNGINPAQPWVLMKMSDMLLTYYGPRNSGRMMVLRRRDTFPSRECNSLAVSGGGILSENKIDRKSTRLNSRHLGISYAR